MSEAKKLQIVGTFNPKEVGADKIVFPEGLNTTYAIGNVKLNNGMGTLVKPGGSLEDFFNVFMDEKNPTVTKPSIDLNFPNAGTWEVGSYVPITYAATLNKGSYAYGPDTGITVSTTEGVHSTGWEIIDTEGNTSGSNRKGFGDYELQVKDDTNYKITAKAYHTKGAVPVTNIGNEYPAGQIKAGYVTKDSGTITGYRPSFYGTFTYQPEINSDTIRQPNGHMTKTSKALGGGSTFSIDVMWGDRLVVIAYPATLRDLTSVVDVGGGGFNIVDSFVKQYVQIKGANDYDSILYQVYTLPFAFGYPQDNTFNVTI